MLDSYLKGAMNVSDVCTLYTLLIYTSKYNPPMFFHSSGASILHYHVRTFSGEFVNHWNDCDDLIELLR